MSLDLNLLQVLVTLGERASVSAAARELRRSQPAISAALAKLRTFFADPLFVRSAGGMHPTPRAVALIQAARQILARVESEILAAPVFDPATSRQDITIALSDVGEVVFLPAILQEVQRLAPFAAVRSVSVPVEEVGARLEGGTIDLAVGYFPDLKQSNFYQQVLFSDGFSSLVRAGHPVAAAKLTLKEYMSLGHAVVRAESRTEEVIERYLERRNLHRRIVLTTPHFASAPILIAQSDLIVTVPEPLARYFTRVSADLQIVKLPFELPRIELKQFWHRKVHHDARSRWLRSLVAQLFQPKNKRSPIGQRRKELR